MNEVRRGDVKLLKRSPHGIPFLACSYSSSSYSWQEGNQSQDSVEDVLLSTTEREAGKKRGLPVDNNISILLATTALCTASLAIMFALISLFNRNIGVDLYSRLA
jgi:hypothetical protein